MNEKAIIQNCIEILADLAGTMNRRAECEAKHDRYAAACEFQTLAKGISMAVSRLEFLKQEDK